MDISRHLSAGGTEKLCLSGRGVLLPRRTSGVDFPFSVGLFLLVSSVSAFSVLYGILRCFFSLIWPPPRSQWVSFNRLIYLLGRGLRIVDRLPAPTGNELLFSPGAISKS